MLDDRKAAHIILLISLILASVSIAALALNNQGENKLEPPIITIYGKSGITKVLDKTQILNLDYVEGFSIYENRFNNWRDPGIYRGVNISTLIELAGGMSQNDIIEVIAIDGYTQNFTYANVYPNSSWFSIQGYFILAYSYNGTVVPDWSDGYRIAFIPPDGNYSNADAKNTTDGVPLPTSAGERWVKNVKEIRILSTDTSTQMHTLSKIPIVHYGGEAHKICASDRFFVFEHPPYTSRASPPNFYNR